MTTLHVLDPGFVHALNHGIARLDLVIKYIEEYKLHKNDLGLMLYGVIGNAIRNNNQKKVDDEYMPVIIELLELGANVNYEYEQFDNTDAPQATILNSVVNSYSIDKRGSDLNTYIGKAILELLILYGANPSHIYEWEENAFTDSLWVAAWDHNDISMFKTLLKNIDSKPLKRRYCKSGLLISDGTEPCETHTIEEWAVIRSGDEYWGKIPKKILDSISLIRYERLASGREKLKKVTTMLKTINAFKSGLTYKPSSMTVMNLLGKEFIGKNIFESEQKCMDAIVHGKIITKDQLYFIAKGMKLKPTRSMTKAELCRLIMNLG